MLLMYINFCISNQHDGYSFYWRYNVVFLLDTKYMQLSCKISVNIILKIRMVKNTAKIYKKNEFNKYFDENQLNTLISAERKCIKCTLVHVY